MSAPAAARSNQAGDSTALLTLLIATPGSQTNGQHTACKHVQIVHTQRRRSEGALPFARLYGHQTPLCKITRPRLAFRPPGIHEALKVSPPPPPSPSPKHAFLFMISVRHLLWWMTQRLQSFCGLLFVDEIRRGRLVVWYYRLLGARLGRDVFFNTVRVRRRKEGDSGDMRFCFVSSNIVGGKKGKRCRFFSFCCRSCCKRTRSCRIGLAVEPSALSFVVSLRTSCPVGTAEDRTSKSF